MTPYKKVFCWDGELRFKINKYNINIEQNTHHNKRDNTTLHKERTKDNNIARQQHMIIQHGSNTTQQQHGSNTTQQHGSNTTW
jgi:hypothetical protein